MDDKDGPSWLVQVVNLDDEIAFEALSYVWGTQNQSFQYTAIDKGIMFTSTCTQHYLTLRAAIFTSQHGRRLRTMTQRKKASQTLAGI